MSCKLFVLSLKGLVPTGIEQSNSCNAEFSKDNQSKRYVLKQDADKLISSANEKSKQISID